MGRPCYERSGRPVFPVRGDADQRFIRERKTLHIPEKRGDFLVLLKRPFAKSHASRGDLRKRLRKRFGKSLGIEPLDDRTCKLNGVDPLGYLADVLTRIVGHPNSQLNDLLPWGYIEPPELKAVA